MNSKLQGWPCILLKICMISFVIIMLQACLGQKKAQLPLIQETEHSMFYSPNTSDVAREMIYVLASAFEANVGRIHELFEYESEEHQKMVIHVYTDKEQFRSVMGRDTEGSYVANENIIKVYTPVDLSDSNVRAEYTFQVVHEYVHAVIQQINRDVGKVKWLDEGAAYYASGQLEVELAAKILYAAPIFEQFTSPTYFDDNGGSAYFNSGLVVQFIVEEYGKDTLNALIRNPDDLEQILNTSFQDLYEKWISSL